MHGLKRKFNPSVHGFIEQAGLQEGLHIPMHCFDISSQTPSGLTNRERPGTSHDSEYFPSLAGEHLKQESRSFKTDKMALLFTLKCTMQTLVDLLA